MHPGKQAAISLLAIVGAFSIGGVVAGDAAVARPTPTSDERSRPVAANATLDHVDQCVYSDHSISKLMGFEKTVGRTVDCAVVFNDAAPNWAAWSDPWFTRSWAREDQRWASWASGSKGDRRLVITQSLIPDGMPTDWRRRGAAGEYDRHAKELARTLVARGVGNSVIRLAAEANGTWNKDHVGNNPAEYGQWSAFWARTARTMNSVPGADFEFDFTVNSAYRNIPLEQYYPGNAAVDIIGIDQYDSLPGAPWKNTSRWRHTADRPSAFTDLALFAARRHKPLSVPEYGLVEKGKAGAGDNPEYLRGLARDLEGRNVAYMGYFNKNVNGVLRLEQVPRSLAAWKELFGAR